MEGAPDEVAVLLGGDLALAVYPDAAGVSDYLAHHVLGQLVPRSILLYGELGVGFATYRPLRYIVRPFVRVHTGGGVAKSGRYGTLEGVGNKNIAFNVAFKV